MKTVCALALLSAVLFTAGCGNSELADCQQKNQSLESNAAVVQQELQAAKDAAAKKDKAIEDLKAENVQMQTKAMEGIRTMMERESAKDQELKDKLAASQKEATDLRAQLAKATAERDQAVQQLKSANTAAPAPTAPAPAPAPAQ